MPGLFSSNKSNCPINPNMRLWMENSFIWLADTFGLVNIKEKPILLPTPEHFPIRYDRSVESLAKTSDIVAAQMEIDSNEICLHIFEQNLQEFTGDFGNRIFTQIDETSEEKNAAGLYFGKNEQGKYDIMIEKANLGDPENMVGVLAHEFAHIKLLGENRVEFNDEYLTDLTTVIFGLGIFNANAAFKFNQGFDAWAHNSVGYFKQREWGYALALYAWFRDEDNPAWLKYLTPNIKSDFKKSSTFIHDNAERIFHEKYTGGPIDSPNP